MGRRKLNKRKKTSSSDNSQGESFISAQMSSDNTTDCATTDACHKGTQDINDKQKTTEQTSIKMYLNEPNINELHKKIDHMMELLVTKDMFNTEMNRLKSDIIQTLTVKVTELEGRMFDLESENKQLRQEVETLKQNQTNTEERLEQTLYAMTLTNDKINDVEQWTRKSSVRVFGIKDTDKNETHTESEEKIVNLIENKLGVNVRNRIDIAHRVGSFSTISDRAIIVKFKCRKEKIAVIQNRKKLKGSRVSISEDLTVINHQLLIKTKHNPKVESAWSSMGKIFAKLHNGRILTVNQKTNFDSHGSYAKKHTGQIHPLSPKIMVATSTPR